MSQCHAPVHRAKNLEDALNFKAAHPNASILAGGTDLMVAIKKGAVQPELILDISPIRELKEISFSDEDQTLSIGSLVTYSQFINSPLSEHLPILRTAAKNVGARQIQNRGTFGGNVANASPAGDSLPVLLALDCTLELQSQKRGKRLVPITQFFKGYRSTELQDDEILTRLIFPKPKKEEHFFFRKVGTRQAQAISKVSFCGKLHLVDGLVKDVRIAFGSVAPTPIRCYNTEKALLGKQLSLDAVQSLTSDINPIDDIRSTASYRLKTAQNTLRSWLNAHMKR